MINALFFIPAVWVGASYGLIGSCIALVAMQLFNALLQCHLAWRNLSINTRHAASNLRRALQGAVLVLALNGIFVTVLHYLETTIWAGLAASAFANLTAGILFFKPLIKLWREDGA
jgi:hypothetical protein